MIIDFCLAPSNFNSFFLLLMQVALIMLVVVMASAYPAEYPDLVVLNNERSEGNV